MCELSVVGNHIWERRAPRVAEGRVRSECESRRQNAIGAFFFGSITQYTLYEIEDSTWMHRLRLWIANRFHTQLYIFNILSWTDRFCHIDFVEWKVPCCTCGPRARARSRARFPQRTAGDIPKSQRAKLLDFPVLAGPESGALDCVYYLEHTIYILHIEMKPAHQHTTPHRDSQLSLPQTNTHTHTEINTYMRHL